MYSAAAGVLMVAHFMLKTAICPTEKWQVGGRMRHLVHFRGKTVAGGRLERTPGTLLQGNCARWEARGAT